jgi:oligopeptide/dipeptide ABC transporter ATP-binding protein
MDTLLKIENLKVYFDTDEGTVRAVDDISFYINDGETIGIVGESGSGKSVTANAIIQLVDRPGRIVEGSKILFNHKDLVNSTKRELRSIRGKEISMIFQDPMTSLNPVYKIGDQIGEVLRLHLGLSKKESIKRAIELLNKVGISRPEMIVNEYPHSLSGGMRQRVMIAIALACNPKLLIADEPTTALDVTIQAQILELMNAIKKSFNTSIMLISHNMGVICETCDRVIIMYAGQIVEQGLVRDIFKNPKHPYTIGLLNSIPKINIKQSELDSIPGMVPNPMKLPKGCKFAPRCNQVMERCLLEEPQTYHITETHCVRCHLHSNIGMEVEIV